MSEFIESKRAFMDLLRILKVSKLVIEAYHEINDFLDK